MSVYLTPRERMDTLNTQYEPKGTMKNMFFPESASQLHSVKEIEIEIKKGTRSIAPYVRRGSDPIGTTLPGYTMVKYEAPGIAMSHTIAADELAEDKGFGNTVYDPQTPSENLRDRRGEVYTDWLDKIARRMEKQAVESITKFQITLDGEEYGNFVVNFDNTADHAIALTGTDTWDTASGSFTGDKVETLRTAARRINRDINYSGEVLVVMGVDAWYNFKNDESVQSDLDNRRMDIGSIRPELMGADGMRYEGYINGVGPIYTYENYYTDPDTGTITEYFEADRVLVTATPSVIDTDVHYGPVYRFDKSGAPVGMFKTKYFLNDYVNNRGSAIFMEIESHPLLIPKQIDGFVSINTEE